MFLQLSVYLSTGGGTQVSGPWSVTRSFPGGTLVRTGVLPPDSGTPQDWDSPSPPDQDWDTSPDQDWGIPPVRTGYAGDAVPIAVTCRKTLLFLANFKVWVHKYKIHIYFKAYMDVSLFTINLFCLSACRLSRSLSPKTNTVTTTPTVNASVYLGSSTTLSWAPAVNVRIRLLVLLTISLIAFPISCGALLCFYE